ncbi:hypothetical protein [Duganella sp. BuS-21]|uniref:hypothetical protein n=1 Tax=Duganella sp. BuS-21 TaxID=2943848 RepID=UPI0035A6C92B
MKLVHAPGYSIRVITPSTSDTEPVCEVTVAGAATSTVLDGAVLEAALTWKEYVLLFLTNDVPFEDTLNIYLLDRHLNVADYARMYFMYSTGIFSHLDLTEDDTVRFEFLGEMTWTLKLFPEKKFAIPIVSAPLGVHRPHTFFQRFQLSAHPAPKQSNQPGNQALPSRRAGRIRVTPKG